MAERIQRLPDDLINKIAAGEVVERPASVVKELVENALDAQARLIRTEIEGGGQSLVRVRDDGLGMSREDALLALERHATSKLRRVEDLEAVHTHGFRGEALPSIASVSRLVLRTREDAAAAGTEIEVRHGRALEPRDVGHPRGTSVEVSDLFGNVPARRKFLRVESTEAGHVAEALTLLALAHPEAGFVMSSGGRPVIDAPPVDGLPARVHQLFGGELLEELIPVEGGADWVRVHGLVSRPDRTRGVRPSLRLFVNGRAVRDRVLAKAVTEAYRGAGSERGYQALLFLEVPLNLVDVNVHPAKAEVRFADSRTAFTAVERAVREAISRGVRSLPARADTSRVARAVESFGALGASRVAEGESVPWAGAPPSGDRTAGPAPLLEAAAPTVLGQHRNTYIVATDGENLLLVDQHTAHERVRFEWLQARLREGRVESQLLLAPVVVSVAPRLRPLLEELSGSLHDLGYDVEAFGGDSVRVRAVPALLAAGDPGARLLRVLAELAERESGGWLVASGHERLVATLACHSAVRAGEPLPRETMAAIVRELAATEHPGLCPHGRPTRVRVPRDDVARWFGRGGWTRQ